MAATLYILVTLTASVLLAGAQEWRPPPQAKLNQPGQPTYIQTPGDGLYNHTWYIVEDRRQFIFEVKACGGALLAFSAYMDAGEVQVVEIALGVADNSRLEIRAPPTGPARFSTYSADPLHCNEFRTFWVRWARDIILVGRGPIVGEQALMTWTDPNLDYFNAIGLTSVSGNAAIWRISENSASHQVMHTFGDHRYGTLWKGVEGKLFWTFRLRASTGNAHILLAEKLGYTNDGVYEIVIGEGAPSYSRALIRTEVMGGPDTVKANVTWPNLISLTERREFWLCWHQGQIELGRGGLYGVNRLLLWKDPIPISVRYLSLTSSMGSNASWIFPDDQESVSYFITDPTTSMLPDDVYNSAWIVSPRQEFFTAAVRACKDASILIADSLTINPEQMLEVVLGAEENNKTIVRYRGTNVLEKATPGVLSCTETRYFWISWHNGTLRVGPGYIYSLDITLEIALSDMVPSSFGVAALALATPTTQGEWRVQESVGSQIQARTPDFYRDYTHFWRSVTQQSYIVFRVRACSDCHVALSPTPWIDPSESYYDFIISGWSNTQTVIHRVWGAFGSDHREDVSAPMDTTGLLLCDQHVDLWVSWDNNEIKMGRGMLPGYHILMNQTLAIGALPVRAISLSTGWGYTGDFIIDENAADYFMFYTSLTDGIRWLDFDPYITWFAMRLRACDTLKIHLCETRAIQNCYLIQLGTFNNTRSSITARNQVVVESALANVLDCLDSRNFWFRWDTTTRVITVGRGPVPKFNVLMTYQDPNALLNVQYAGFESSNEDFYARWQIDKNAVTAISFYTPTSFTYEQMWETVERRRGISFGVTACSDVHVVLSNRLRWWNDVFDLFIGGMHNTKSVIRATGGPDYTTADTPGILSCTEQRFFWVTWQYGAIEVGRGEVLGEDKFMDYQPLQMYTVSAIGYSTGYDYDGTWYIKTAGPVLTTPTPGTEPPPTRPPSQGGMTQDRVAGLVLGILAGVLLVGIVLIYMRGRGLQAAAGGPDSGSFAPPGDLSGAGGATGPAGEDAGTVDNLDD